MRATEQMYAQSNFQRCRSILDKEHFIAITPASRQRPNNHILGRLELGLLNVPPLKCAIPT